MYRMKFILVATTVALISILSLTYTALAAPMQWKSTSDLKTGKLKSLLSQIRIQQEDSHSTNDKEMAATFCKLVTQLLSYPNLFGKEMFGDISKDDFCQDIELPSEPRPGDKSGNLANAYQIVFSLLKESGIGNTFEEYINSMMGHIG